MAMAKVNRNCNVLYIIFFKRGIFWSNRHLLRHGICKWWLISMLSIFSAVSPPILPWAYWWAKSPAESSANQSPSQVIGQVAGKVWAQARSHPTAEPTSLTAAPTIVQLELTWQDLVDVLTYALQVSEISVFRIWRDVPYFGRLSSLISI